MNVDYLTNGPRSFLVNASHAWRNRECNLLWVVLWRISAAAVTT